MKLPAAFQAQPGNRRVTAIIVGTLAIGVGALTVAFGIVDAALWRQPPFPHAERLAMLYTTHASASEPLHNERWSYPRIQLLRQLARSFERPANYSTTALTLTGTEQTEPVQGEFVSPEYFRTLGVLPATGRTFDDSEDRVAGANPIAVLGHDLWQRRYGGAPMVGRAIGVNGRPVTIIGIMPPGFRGLTNQAEIWIPTTMAPILSYGDYLVTDQNFISVVARLRPGISLEQAQVEMGALGTQIYQGIPSTEGDSTDRVSAAAVSLNAARVDRDTRRALRILLAAVSLLHLLACANVVSLMLGRAMARRREAAVRSALGSTPAALFRRYFTEATALTAIGGASGVLIAAWARPFAVLPLNAWGPRNFYGNLASFSEPAYGWRTFAFGAALTLVTAILVSWAPAASMVRGDLIGALREGMRGSTILAGSLRRPNARGVIVGVETALAVVLLVAGGLMIDSFRRLLRAEIGVVPDHVLTFMLQPSEVQIPPAAAPAFIDRVLRAIEATPGVVSASVDGGAPLSGSASSVLQIVGRPVAPAGEAPPVTRHYVGPKHFTTLGIPLIRGRAFTDQDRTAGPRVTIISEEAARRFWPSGDALGQRVWFGGGSNFDRADSSAEIVGIVGNVPYQPLDRERTRASFYTPYQQFTYAWRIYFVRTAGDPSSMVPAMREAVRGVDPDLPLREVQTLTERIGDSWRRQRFDAYLFGAFAVLALVLASTGIYAVVAYAVGQRTREMGIRLALGSQPTGVLRLVVWEGMTFPCIGLVVGVAAALALARALRGSLYEVGPTNAWVFSATLAVLVGVALVACAIPAIRATRVDPNEALRGE